MSWTDSEGLERGGDSDECGQAVEEEHHAYCADCFREQMGWSRSDPTTLQWQHEDRQETTITTSCHSSGVRRFG